MSKGISHPHFYGDLVYKLRRVKGSDNSILSSSKIVKRLLRRKYEPNIIVRSKSLVFGPSTASYRLLLKHCTLTNRAVGTYDGPSPDLLKGDGLLIFVPSDCWSDSCRVGILACFQGGGRSKTCLH